MSVKKADVAKEFPAVSVSTPEGSKIFAWPSKEAKAAGVVACPSCEAPNVAIKDQDGQHIRCRCNDSKRVEV